MIDLKLSNDDKPFDMSYLYNHWILQQKEKKRGYFLLSNSLEEYLPLVKTAAMNLYLFYAIHAKNEYGYSYFSNDEIAKRLGVSKKTISNWVKTLLDAGLIARKAQQNSSSITYLLPTTDLIINSDNLNKTQKIMELLRNEGYKLIIPITITVISDNNMQTYKYYQYSRKYEKDNNSITRKVIINDKTIANVQKTANLFFTRSNFSWFTTKQTGFKDSFNIIWRLKPNQKDNSENRQSILAQLNSEEAINKFKNSYQEEKLY